MRIQPTDIAHTAEAYASVSPDKVTLIPYLGSESIEPFVRHGREVEVIGCMPLFHPSVCAQIQEVLKSWDMPITILDCETVAQRMA